MKPGFCPMIKVMSILVVGVAFFLSGCYPKKAMEKAPVKEIPIDHFTLAEQCFQAADYDMAIGHYELYLKQHPTGEKSRKALYRIGKIYDHNFEYDKALAFFKRVAREYPDHPEVPIVKYDISTAYYRLGDHENSKNGASEWLKRYPNHSLKGEVLLLMWRNWEALKNTPKAFYWSLKAAGVFYDSPNRRRKINERIIGLIGNSSIEELKEMSEYAVASDYEPHIYHQMATLYLDENKLNQAKDAAMALVRSTPEQSWVSMGRQILDSIEQRLSVKEGVIGCLLPLSGPFAIYGQEVLNGIQLGMDIFNRSEGDQGLELIIRDTGGKTDNAVSAVQELTSKEKVMALIGPLASKPALGAARKAQELGVPIITLTQKDGITAEGEMVFRNFLIPSKEIKGLLDKAMREIQVKRFAILYPDNAYGRFFMNLFWDKVEEMGGEIRAVESYKVDETDFAVQIKKMVGLFYPRPESVVQMLEAMKEPDTEEEKGAEQDSGEEKEGDGDSEEEPEPIVDFDAVFIPDNYQQVALIAPQFPFHNVFNVLFLGTSLWQSPELIEMAGDYVQGAIFPSGFFDKAPSARIRDFVERYQENFDSEPGILAANGYDTIRFLENLMARGPTLTREDFQEKILENDNFHGVTGKIRFDRQGEVEKDPILLTISGKGFHLLP